jgi:hypothetical protein
MSFLKLLKSLVQMFFGWRGYKRWMRQIRTSTQQRAAIDGIMAAYRKGDYEEARIWRRLIPFSPATCS